MEILLGVAPPPDEQVKDIPKPKRKRKFIVGNMYGLRIKSVEGSRELFFSYVCIKTIHQIRGQQVDILIMKRYDDGRKYNMQCLSRTDCLRYHIKYQPGLEVMSSKLNWIDIKRKN